MGVELDFEVHVEEPETSSSAAKSADGARCDERKDESASAERVPPASISSLKWAVYGDRKGVLHRHGIGLSDAAIPPKTMAAGCRGALREVVEFVAEDDEQLRLALERGEGWWEIAALFWKSSARDKRFGDNDDAVPASQWAHTLSLMLEAGEAGFAGRWSF